MRRSSTRDSRDPRSEPPEDHRQSGVCAVESAPVAVYVPETFTSDEADVLRRYFTNLDGPVFALVNLPEVVKGALFARYSRSPKSLRRLFLDEFVGDLDIRGDQSIDATIGLDRAEQLYERVFFDYGDDSVAQLGGVHLACEQASNLLTKVLEWGRLMSYLEQSTRYIAYDSRLGGRYRYHRDLPLTLPSLPTRRAALGVVCCSSLKWLLPIRAPFSRGCVLVDSWRVQDGVGGNQKRSGALACAYMHMHGILVLAQ